VVGITQIKTVSSFHQNLSESYNQVRLAKKKYVAGSGEKMKKTQNEPKLNVLDSFSVQN
jgi:hypothetical protein